MALPLLVAAIGGLAYYTMRLFWKQRQPSRPSQPNQAPHMPVHRRPSPASNPQSSYYPRTPKDITKVIEVLCNYLPAELALEVIKAAEYWVCEEASRDERLVIAEPSAGTAYLRSWPILWASGGATSNSPPYPGTSLTFDDLAEDAPESSPLSPKHRSRSDESPGPVKQITFTISARDQGWSSFPQWHGTYEGSHTWFEARVIQPSASQQPIAEEAGGGNGVPRRRMTFTCDLSREEMELWRPRLVQVNLHASRQEKTHIVTWRWDAEDEEERKWVRDLKQGECVELTIWARYPGWANHVQSAKIDVFVED